MIARTSRAASPNLRGRAFANTAVNGETALIYLRNGHTLMALEDGSGAGGTAATENLPVVGKIIVDEINKWCNVRSGPGMEYTIIGKAKKNDTYNVYGVVEDWYQIDYNGSVGYLYGDLASEVLPGNV